MKSSIRTEIILNAMLMAKWRRQHKQSVTIYSGQDSQFGSDYFGHPPCKNIWMIGSIITIMKELIRRKFGNFTQWKTDLR